MTDSKVAQNNSRFARFCLLVEFHWREVYKTLLLGKVKDNNKFKKESMDALDMYMGTMRGHYHGHGYRAKKLGADFGPNAELEDLRHDEDWVAAGGSNRGVQLEMHWLLLN